jgi:hypothetical protein
MTDDGQFNEKGEGFELAERCAVEGRRHRLDTGVGSDLGAERCVGLWLLFDQGPAASLAVGDGGPRAADSVLQPSRGASGDIGGDTLGVNRAM